MKYVVLFGSSFVFVALRHFSSQRNRQAELELNENRASAAAAERAAQRERTR